MTPKKLSASTIAAYHDGNFTATWSHVQDLLGHIGALEAEISKLQLALKIAKAEKSPEAYQETIDLFKDENAALREIAKTATSKLWSYCPECGSEETHYEGGRHNWCQSCGQEWFVDIDYSDTVPKVLRIRMKERDALKAKVERYFGMLELVHQVLSEEADGDIMAEFLLPKISAALSDKGE